jgi:Cd2+/Zn2+-exporting ATPase
VLQGARERGVVAGAVADFAHRAGHGLTGRVEGAAVIVGNRAQLAATGVELTAAAEASAAALEQNGKTTIFVAVGDGQNMAAVAGVLAVRDEPRPEAAGAIAALRGLGVKRLVMLTGDNERVARAVGAELGLDEVHAALLPEDKARLVRELRARYTRVIVVGDGINDAPAMAAADVAEAMGGAGSAVALETADIALMADDLTRLPYAISLSRASRRTIVINLVVSLGVIALLVPSALLGLAGIGVAVAIHESSTLVVVANALRLLAFRERGVTAA